MKQFMPLLSWIVASVLALGAVVTPAGAQKPAKIPRVGVLATSATLPVTQAFRQGLRDLGYVEGENIIVEYRFNEGRGERLPGLAAELVDLKVDIIVALGAIHAQALQRATATIPVVFAIQPDAVAVGLVADTARPGGNLTGFTSFDPEQARKQLGLLKEVIPRLTRVAILWDRDTAAAVPARENEDQARVLGPAARQSEAQARALGLEPQLLGLQASNLDLEGAFEAARRERAEALVVLSQPVTGLNGKAIAELAITYRLPALTPLDGVDDDWHGLVAYGTRFAAAARRIPAYVDKILKGANPGNLPVEAVTRNELIINLETARKISVTIPPEVLKKADRVIQ